MSSSIAENLNSIRAQLPETVTLVAVSKTKSVEDIVEAYQAGQRDFGENYVQELIEKQPKLPADIRWHFIGHMQSNKVKYIAPFIHLIHGVDSLKLLKEINKQAAKNNRIIDCLLQVYIAQEETKFGFDKNEIMALRTDSQLAELKNIRVCGLMAMASNTDNESIIEKEFADLKILFDSCSQEFQGPNINFSILSIGMSSDFELAVKQGSTMVRIGSLIFGSRIYSYS